MVFTNPKRTASTQFLYLLSIFLALVAMPLSMGILMAYHPFGAWSVESVERPFSHLHPVAFLLIVFSGIGFAFLGQETAYRLGHSHPLRIKIVTWVWGIVWLGAHCFLARAGVWDRFLYPPHPGFLVCVLLGTWIPIGYVYSKTAQPLTKLARG